MRHPAILISSLVVSMFLSGVYGQDFDTWFGEGAMRIDLVFSGTSGETSYALTGIRKEPFYSGSHSVLIDPFDYGDHLLLVRDLQSGTPIYSQTYCTLFREWQTTSEADTVRRAFTHVVRFPWPRSPVSVEIHDRDKAGVFRFTWSGSFDPGSYFIDRVQPLKFEAVDLELNGPPEWKVDLLFLAEGYTETEMDKFIADARRSMEHIFSEEPFKSNRTSFNVRAVKSISDDSGTDVPGAGIWKRTIMNSNFYTFGIERYMTTLDYKSVCDVAANAPCDQIYILVNTSKYGGGGMYNLYAISAADNEDSRAVLVHEFGHAFAGLADEYYESEVAYNDFFPLEVEPWNPNLTTLVDFDSKWGDLIPEGTPVPTPSEERYMKTVGVFEGGGYVSKGVFRPMIDCLMHSNEAPFCPVCQHAVLLMIHRYTGE